MTGVTQGTLGQTPVARRGACTRCGQKRQPAPRLRRLSGLKDAGLFYTKKNSSKWGWELGCYHLTTMACMEHVSDLNWPKAWMSALTTSAALAFVLLEQKYFPAPEPPLLQRHPFLIKFS